MLAVADQAKPGARAAVDRLRALGLETVLLTGDHQATARAVAAELGVDAVALAQADVGVALGGGTDVAVEASDLTLVGGDPGGVADAVALSRETYATIKQNLFWAFAYNVAAIPLAALGRLHPMVAAAAMSLSSVFVVGCSLQLRRFSPARPLATRARRLALAGVAVAAFRRPRPVLPPPPASRRPPARAPGRPHRPPGAAMTTETLSVPDISCDHCQRTIESALGRLPGVQAASVDVAARTVQVTYDETALDQATINATLAEEGYEVAVA